MILSSNEIKQVNLIHDGDDKHHKQVGYNLSVGKIIDPDGGEHESYTLEPGRIAWLVSKERVVLPNDVMAYATIKTGLCQEGLLALNIGIVDPGWAAPLATPIINFGAQKHALSIGEEFLRLTFHKNVQFDGKENKTCNEGYLKKTKKYAIEKFGDSFLNIERELEKIRRLRFGQELSKWVGWATIAGIGLIIVSISVGIGIGLVSMKHRATTDADVARIGALEGEVRALTCKLDSMERGVEPNGC